jgi:hypothetical protein
MQMKRPFGVDVALCFYVTWVVLTLSRVLVDLDLHLYRFILRPSRIPDLVFGLLSVFVVVGLTKMRPWGRMLAIILSAIATTSVISFYCVIVALRLWTLLPHSIWSNAKNVLFLTFGIYNVWYLLRPTARDAFRPATLQHSLRN